MGDVVGLGRQDERPFAACAEQQHFPHKKKKRKKKKKKENSRLLFDVELKRPISVDSDLVSSRTNVFTRIVDDGASTFKSYCEYWEVSTRCVGLLITKLHPSSPPTLKADRYLLLQSFVVELGRSFQAGAMHFAFRACCSSQFQLEVLSCFIEKDIGDVSLLDKEISITSSDGWGT